MVGKLLVRRSFFVLLSSYDEVGVVEQVAYYFLLERVVVLQNDRQFLVFFGETDLIDHFEKRLFGQISDFEDLLKAFEVRLDLLEAGLVLELEHALGS